MTKIKLQRAFKIAGIASMPRTREHVLQNIARGNDEAILSSLTARQFACVIKATMTAYLDGQNSKIE